MMRNTAPGRWRALPITGLWIGTSAAVTPRKTATVSPAGCRWGVPRPSACSSRQAMAIRAETAQERGRRVHRELA